MKTLTLKEETFQRLLTEDKYNDVGIEGCMRAKEWTGDIIVAKDLFSGYECINVIIKLLLSKLQSDVINSYYIEPNDDLTVKLVLSEQEIVTTKWSKDES